MRKTYFIKNKKFQKIYETSKELHGNISIIKMFCKAFEDVDDFYQVLPLINHTYAISDKLYSQLIDIKR
jgi:hypothetical protein